MQSSKGNNMQKYGLGSSKTKSTARIGAKGFTLAEVLITLGIIGVVAALTIPTIMQSITKKKLETQIKGAYSAIAQTMRAVEADDLGFDMKIVSDEKQDSTNNWFKTYILPYLKTETVCYNKAGCWHKKGTVKDLLGNPSPWDYEAGLGNYIVTFTTAKGAYFNIDGMNSYRMKTLFGINTDNLGLVFYFDANGDRKPNVIGKDIYILAYTDKGLVPAGSDKTLAEVEQNCFAGNGYWCLAYLKAHGWQISDKVWKR